MLGQGTGTGREVAQGRCLSSSSQQSAICSDFGQFLPFGAMPGARGDACHSLGAQQSARCTAGSWSPRWGECPGPHLACGRPGPLPLALTFRGAGLCGEAAGGG